VKISSTLLSIVMILSFSAQAAAPKVFDPFAGKWTGKLEYQDYQGSGRVSIPVKLEVKPSNETTAIWDFVYDDFGKLVPSFETHVWNGSKYTVMTKGKTEVLTYTSKDFAKLIAAKVGKSVLLGFEIEFGAKVEVRRTIILELQKLVTLKETRLKGEKFTFRNQSTYSRQP
jgi:hypothetical protein